MLNVPKIFYCFTFFKKLIFLLLFLILVSFFKKLPLFSINFFGTFLVLKKGVKKWVENGRKSGSRRGLSSDGHFLLILVLMVPKSGHFYPPFFVNF